MKRTPVEIEWRNMAHRAVHRAVKCGWLPDLRTGEYACVDCGGVADRWEHRDYSRVLDVDPVCHACNMRRGKGAMPVIDRVFVKVSNPVAIADIEPVKRFEPIEAAIKACGSNRELADALGVHPALVSQWLTFRRPVAATRAIAIELATGGVVTRYELRPDVFGADPVQHSTRQRQSAVRKRAA